MATSMAPGDPLAHATMDTFGGSHCPPREIHNPNAKTIVIHCSPQYESSLLQARYADKHYSLGSPMASTHPDSTDIAFDSRPVRNLPQTTCLTHWRGINSRNLRYLFRTRVASAQSLCAVLEGLSHGSQFATYLVPIDVGSSSLPDDYVAASQHSVGGFVDLSRDKRLVQQTDNAQSAADGGVIAHAVPVADVERRLQGWALAPRVMLLSWERGNFYGAVADALVTWALLITAGCRLVGASTPSKWSTRLWWWWGADEQEIERVSSGSSAPTNSRESTPDARRKNGGFYRFFPRLNNPPLSLESFVKSLLKKSLF